MKARQLIIIAAVLFLAGSFALNKYLTDLKKPQDRIDARVIAAVSVQPASIGAVRLTIPVTGKLVAKDRLDIYAEVSGVVLPAGGKEFKEGVAFNRGETLLNIDNREAQNSLLAQRSQLLNLLTTSLADLKLDFPAAYPKWKTYVDAYSLDSKTPQLPEVSDPKEKFFVSSRNIYNLFYQLKAAEVRLEKFHVTAPYSGVVTTAMIDHGAMIRAGQKVGEFIAPNSYELEANISLNEAAMLQRGDTVFLQSKELNGKWTGTVSRINDQIDSKTQSVKVYVAVSGDRLKEGLFMEGQARAKTVESAMSIPRSLLLANKQVYVVRDTLLDVVAVDVLQYSEDQAVVRGLTLRDTLLTTRVAGAYKGMVVKVKAN